MIASLLAAPALFAGEQAEGRGFRRAEDNGWLFVHLEGAPSAIGFQHGRLLKDEIEDTQKAIALAAGNNMGQTWQQLRELARDVIWPKVPAEYRAELKGIVKGLRSRGSKLDLIDLVAVNANMEFEYLLEERKRRAGVTSTRSVPGHCSAFVATGSYTKDGGIVIGHNNWTDYLLGGRWRVIFDIVPARGHRILMDGLPGLIHSGDDFGINDAGLLITETTIEDFHGFDERGVAEFVRARRAMQYAASIDEFAGIMKDGNNGAYANTWLIGDRKTGEIARLELGLKNVTLERTRDGYFTGANFPIDPKLAAEETTYPVNDPDAPNTVRRRRWEQLIAEHKGRIDIETAKQFETDHVDAVTGQADPNERTICGHLDRSSRGIAGWAKPYAPIGVGQVKVADSAGAARLSFVAGFGHPCGTEFDAAAHLARYPEFAWQKSLLGDIKSHTWTVVEAARK